MEKSFEQTDPNAQNNQYSKIYISGNARAILGNVLGDHDFLRPQAYPDWKDTIRALHYDGIRTRKAQIDANAASPEYVKWIWDTPFVEWLQSDESFFWITGLPGSGKSTLMKHIADSRRTKQTLEHDGSKWSVIQFYFDFRAGNAVANSLEGLLRSMLSGIVKHCPELVSHIVSPLENGLTDLSLSSCLDRICDAMKAASFKVCAFIDGLDEFDGSGSDLVEIIRSLEDRAGFKLCLASRPYQIFQSSFSMHRTLVMQDYNGDSMRMYAQAQWESNRLGVHPGLSESFTSRILHKARGIFLWARLAIDELLLGLLKGTPMSLLEAQLEEMPKGVKAMYEHILERTPEILHTEAAMLLHLIMCANRADIALIDLYTILEAYVRRWSTLDRVVILPIDLDDEESLVARIKNVLGNFIDLHSRPLHSEDVPRVTLRRGRLVKRYISQPEVALAHETLRQLHNSGWIVARIPDEWKSVQSRCLWLEIFIGEMEVVDPQHTRVLSKDISQLRDFIGESRPRSLDSVAGRRMSTAGSPGDMVDRLLSYMEHGAPHWTPLLLMVLYDIFSEISSSRPLAPNLARRINETLSTSISCYHALVCIFHYPRRRVFVQRGNMYDDIPGCTDCLSHDIITHIETIGWEGFYSITHFLPELSLQNERLGNYGHPSQEAQILFANFVRQGFTYGLDEQLYKSLLDHLLSHGARIQSQLICWLLRHHAVMQYPALDLLATAAKYPSQCHSQDCYLYTKNNPDASFLCHWLDIRVTSGSEESGLDLILRYLIRCGEQTGACYQGQTLLNAIVEVVPGRDSQFPYPMEKMLKLMVALRGGADPLLVGRTGNAIRTAEDSLTILDSLSNIVDSSRLPPGLQFILGIDSVKLGFLAVVRYEAAQMLSLLKHFVRNGRLTERDYTHYRAIRDTAYTRYLSSPSDFEVWSRRSYNDTLQGHDGQSTSANGHSGGIQNDL